ncbi:MAG TPA: SRPBCC family protein [Solirubrobacteraceae bacterium]|nr:SRPBCC family protein [Solirubrobacteraceae bacterium]
MAVQRLHREQLVSCGVREVAEFFSRPANLALLTPPGMRFELLTPEPLEMADGTLIEYRVRVRGIPIRCVSQIEDWRPGSGFADRQLRGPYRHWLHRHRFEAAEGGTRIVDDVDYELRLAPLGDIFAGPLVRRDLARIFDFRQVAAERCLGVRPAVS